MPIALASHFSPKASRTQIIFWFSLSLTVAAVLGVICLQQAFSSDSVVQDDARQHVFWMRRFLDPALFPNDLIADYFQSVAPAGYTTLYWIFAKLGIDPIVFSKLLPIGLGLILTAYCFGVSMQILPVPLAAFVSTLLLNQCVWMKYDVSSGTPRAFAFPLLLAFAYYLLKRDAENDFWKALLPCLGTIALLGLFYPHLVFIAAGILILRLVRWQEGRLQLSRDRRDWGFSAAGLAIAVLILLPYALESSQFGPAISAAEAKLSPEFWSKGRAPFFDTRDPIDYWLFSRGSGFFPRELPWLVQVGWLLPVLLIWRDRVPLIQQTTRGVALLPQLVLASLGMFLLAHLVLFKLHLPNRYTGISLRIALSIAASLVLVASLDALMRWLDQKRQPLLAWAAVGLVAIVLVFYPTTLRRFPNPRYVVGTEPALYQFYAQQPKDTLTASLSPEADNLPTFSQRSTLAGREYGVPYQVGYYRQIRQRAEQLIAAQYSPTLAAAQQVIQTYGVDFWLLDLTAFDAEYVTDHDWLKSFPKFREQALKQLAVQPPALAKLVGHCNAFESDRIVVLRADCIATSHF
jgi:hypothetical protein